MKKNAIVRACLLLALLVLTAWNVFRSDRLEKATEAHRTRKPLSTLQASLDHLRRRPWSRAAERLAALSLSRLDFAEEAEARYRKAGPLSLDDRKARAFAILRANRREDAIKAYQEILEDYPNDVEALRNLSTVYLTQMQYREAAAVAERLAGLPGQEVFGLTMVGTMHHHLTEAERAVAAFQRVVELDPQLSRMPLDRGQFDLYFASDLFDAGRAREAAEWLAASPALESDPMLLVLKGVAHLSLSELDEAEGCWRRALEINAALPQAWTNLGKLELLRNQPERAIEALQRADALQPNDYTTLYNLVMANRRLGKTEEAADYQSRLDRLKARSGTPTMTMGTGAVTPEDAHD